MNRYRAAPLLGVACAAGLVSACFLSPKPDPTRYYVLSGLEEDPGLYSAAGLVGDDPATAARSAGLPLDIRIGVGPITFPSYLTRTRMATRMADNQLGYSETDRWAEPLEEAFRYALAGDMEFIIGTDQVILHPWYRTDHPDVTVGVDVVRFERDHVGTVRLAGNWELRDATGETLGSRSFSIEEPANQESIASSVRAQSRAVAALAREIADEIRRADS